jgi:integrase/recombinase XerC
MKYETLSAPLLPSFVADLKLRGLSEHTIRGYVSDLRTLLAYAEMDILPHGDFFNAAATWLNDTRAEVAPTTTLRRLASLKAFAYWADWDTADLKRYKAPKPARAMPHPIEEGMDGVREMLKHAYSLNEKLLVCLTGFGGMRISEARNVKPRDIDFSRKLVTVRGKGDKQRRIPFGTTNPTMMHLAHAVSIAPSRDAPLITLQDRGARKALTRLGVAAGLIRPLASHDMRATAATGLFNRTKNIRLVQEFLGHATIHQTEVYTGVTMEDMMLGVAAL